MRLEHQWDVTAKARREVGGLARLVGVELLITELNSRLRDHGAHPPPGIGDSGSRERQLGDLDRLGDVVDRADVDAVLTR